MGSAHSDLPSVQVYRKVDYFTFSLEKFLGICAWEHKPRSGVRSPLGLGREWEMLGGCVPCPLPRWGCAPGTLPAQAGGTTVWQDGTETSETWNPGWFVQKLPVGSFAVFWA